MADILGLLVLAGALWVSGYMAALVLDQRSWYIDLTVTGLDQTARAIYWLWCRRKEIFWMAVGFAICFLLMV